MSWVPTAIRPGVSGALVLAAAGVGLWAMGGAWALAMLSEIGISLQSPGYGAALMLIPVFVAMGAFSLTGHGWPQATLSMVLRGAMILAIVLALVGPRISQERPSLTATVFVVDVSDSISDDALERTRKAVQSAWRGRGESEVRVVTYGGSAQSVAPPERADQPWPSFARHAPPSSQASDTERALALALTLLPDDRLGRVVLATDGRDTRGDGLAMIANAERFGVTIHHLSLGDEEAPLELVVVDVAVPKRPIRKVPFPVRARLHATGPMKAQCELLVDGVSDQDRELALEAGDDEVVFTATLSGEGDHEITVACQPANPGDDRFDSNNRVTRALHVPSRPKVLYVEGEPRYARNLLRALEDDFEVELRSARGLPRRAADAGAFDAILISDVARLGAMGVEQMSASQMRVLEGYVRRGGGLILTGGENAFGPGGYGGTHLERAVLPVRLDVDREEEIPSLAMVLVLDRSGSMSGEKLSLAKEAARVTLEVLQPSDKLGIVAFDSAPRVLVRLQRASNRLRITDALSQLAPGGGTSIFPALDQAVQMLSATEAKIKHVILLTDGQSNRSGVLDLVALAGREKITISTVAVGAGSDQDLLMQVAEEGGGRYYFTDRADNIPRLFLKEASEVSRRSMVEERFRPRVSARHRRAQVFSGIDIGRAPPLLGYVSTRAKRRAEVLLRTHKGEPLLARWRLGLGQVWVWTSDLKNKWAHHWLRWPGYAQLWRQLIRDALRVERADPMLAMAAEIDQGVLRVAVDAVDAGDQFIDGLKSTVVIQTPDGKDLPLSLAQVAPGHYVGHQALEALGAYTIRGTHGDPAAPEATLRSATHLTWPYPDEHAVGVADLSVAEALSRATGGVADPSAHQLFDHEGAMTSTQVDRRAALIWLALGLLLLDVLVRRLRFPEIRERA
jgi:Ca-activated chloride channel family protein